MCRSKAEGGQRCSAHAGATYWKAVANGTYTRVAEAAVAFASTPAGREHFLAALATTADLSDRIRVEMILTEGEALRLVFARSAAEQRGIRGDFSRRPTSDEIDAYVCAAAGAAEVHAMTVTRGEVASLFADLNDPAAGAPLNVSALAVSTKEVPNGYEVALEEVEVGGLRLARGSAEYARVEDRVIAAAGTRLGAETRHQLCGDLGREHGRLHSDDAADRVWKGRKAAKRFANEIEDLGLAQKLSIAQELPDGVDTVSYAVHRRSAKSSSIVVNSVATADGRNATHLLSHADAKKLIRSKIGEFDEISRFQAMRESQVVSRAHAQWRPTPL